MKTLYEQAAKQWDAIGLAGFPCVAEMSRHFYSVGKMDAALGYSKGASHWMNGRNPPTDRAEYRARDWLASNVKASTPKPPKEPDPQTPSGRIFLVAGDAPAIVKLEKLAALIGIELVEV